MSSYHHSGERKNRGKGEDVKRIRGENKKRSSRNTGRVTRNTDSNPRDRKFSTSSKNRYQKEKSKRITNQHGLGAQNVPTDSTASRRTPRLSPNQRENHGSEDSNSCNNHNDDEYEPYVYEKIDGWDTDTDDEETTKSREVIGLQELHELPCIVSDFLVVVSLFFPFILS
ncbi:unnamed protein product [Caenorhabditis brenneri]